MRGWRAWFERPSIAELQGSAPALRPALGAWRLLALGLGAVVGAGAFSVLGLAAQAAGAWVLVAIVLVVVLSALVALSYAELATLLPVSGSSYSFALAAMGPLVAWLVAWSIALSYVVGNGAVAASLSANLQAALASGGVALPAALRAAPGSGGLVDLPAFLVVVAITLMLLRPVKESATLNALLVAAKVAILLVFVAIGVAARPALPTPPAVAPAGIASATALIFFAFLGFESVSAASQEARDPARDVPRAILGTLAAAALLYAVLTLVLLALAPSRDALATAEPLSAALRARGYGGAAALLNIGGVLATLGVLVVYMLATARIFLAFAPSWLARLHPRHATPDRMTLVVGFATAASAALLPIGLLVTLTNEANLVFFGLVCLSVPILRRREPTAPRRFRAPSWVPWAGALACGALMATFGLAVHVGFVGWLGAGLMLFALGVSRPRTA